MQAKAHAKQEAVEHPELGLEHDVFDLPHQLISHSLPGGIVSAKTEHVDQQDPEQGHAAQHIEKCDAVYVSDLSGQKRTSHSWSTSCSVLPSPLDRA